MANAAEAAISEDPKIVLMRACIEEATQNASSGRGGPFAAVVVRAGASVASGANAVTSLNDPTAHAEIQAIRAAATALGTFDLTGCELYTSCEPCPMCLAASYWARFDRVYYAATRVDAAAAGFDDERIYAELGEPTVERTLSVVLIPMKEATLPFRAWNGNPNRVRY
jgi:tRNA(Arg) A34 adenosine deaminase TadA